MLKREKAETRRFEQVPEKKLFFLNILKDSFKHEFKIV